MTDLFHKYTAAGSEPEFLELSLRNGLLQITVRGEPTLAMVDDPTHGLIQTARPGETVTLTLPPLAVAELAIALLKVPPGTSLIDKVPHVCWFDTPARRDEFVAALGQELEVRQVELRDEW